jgi:hypothetical protein
VRQFGDESGLKKSSETETLFISFKDGLCMFECFLGEPAIVSTRVSFPGDKILDLFVFGLVSLDRFYFIFFFLIDNVRWWFREVWSVYLCLLIGR